LNVAKKNKKAEPFGSACLPYASSDLNIEVFHVQRIFFDELAPGFHVFAHQCGEDRLRLRNVLQLD
jgi:hypothetical protein